MKPLDLLLWYIDEDCPSGDVTSDLISPDVMCKAVILAENEGVIAGIEEAGMLFSHYGVKAEPLVSDGIRVHKGQKLIALTGSAKGILLVERTVLNVIGRMSGIATKTRALADKINSVNPKCRIAATRKTSPGFRLFDKKAVSLGGGDPHRFSLSDGILVKDNHLAFVSAAEAIRRAKQATLYKKIEIEAESREAAEKAARAGADIILLDNMTPEEVKATINALEKEGLRNQVLIEISGGIDDQTIMAYASLDIDCISLGALTHTVKNFSVTLEILPQ